jgi:uncharacterized repeat protein (TIGR03803 family)
MKARMKNHIIRPFLALAVIAGLDLIPPGRATAQTYTTLHSFAAEGETVVDEEPFYVNSDGANPSGGLISSGGTLYGTAKFAGPLGSGTLFAVNTDGTGFTNLHVFGQRHNFGGYVPDTNPDGMYPISLILSDHNLHGTAHCGGSSGYGTVFAVNTNGTGFTTLHAFTGGSEGAGPSAGLILLGNTLYGTASSAGSFGSGTVFSLSFPLPQLTITLSGTDVILSWPTNIAGFDYSGYMLQSAPASTGPFTNLPGATNPCIKPITGVPEYFRLILY